MNWFDFSNFFSPTHNEKKRADTALHRRSERPKNGADAQPCLSDVYKNSTRAKRRQADVPLCGRSMVEMLGVLAIIGVLSVGAMSGYSKAMFKYKLNKQAEQINTVINAVARFAHSFSKDYRNQYLTSFFIKMDEIPIEMIHDGEEGRIYDAFNLRWGIYYNYDENTGQESMNLVFKDSETLTNNFSQNLEICRNLIITAKENSSNILYISTLSGYQTEEEQIGILYGDNACLSGRTCLKNATLEQIYDICTRHAGTEDVEFKIVWKIR